ncbi:two-component system, chemotaxis family, response regulator CheY [Mariprofundus micogutta]|uniref:Two-component system, chemotaxis family, response regulator CheY n=1 Tax=Mariprofundus micogutta TaxID=1921010 RepID=A0A1L8CNP0_9PROT|nr:response regulator [Mariprofundus micogutta]GAV20531.1 two-component system, chemotaxis family, response regulator CheY [Mariprofundus micogutta]
MTGQVLIIDDARVVRISLGRIMRKCGYDVLEAANGEQALEVYASSQDIQVIFLDINMPVMGGMEFLEEFKSRFAATDRPPVIIVSTETETSSILKAISLGASEYVMKPFDEAIIKSKLDIVGIAYQS